MARVKYSIQDKLNIFTPIICRLLARVRIPNSRRYRAMTDIEICASSGITIARLIEIYQLTSWDTVTTKEMFQFMKGCNLDISNRDSFKRNMAIIEILPHLVPHEDSNSAEWNTVFKPLLMILAKNK